MAGSLRSFRKNLDRAAQVRDRVGLRGVLKEALDRIVLRMASLQVMRVYVLESGALPAVPIGSHLEIRPLDAEDVARFALDDSNRLGPEFVERARFGFDLCFGAIHEGRLASYAWCALGSVEGEHAAGVDIGLPGHTAYLYKGFTHSDFRGRHLYPACMGAALDALRPRGVERLIAFVRWTNLAGRRSCERAGYRDLGLLVVGPRGPIRIPAEARALGLRFGADADVSPRTQRSSERAR